MIVRKQKLAASFYKKLTASHLLKSGQGSPHVWKPVTRTTGGSVCRYACSVFLTFKKPTRAERPANSQTRARVPVGGSLNSGTGWYCQIEVIFVDVEMRHHCSPMSQIGTKSERWGCTFWKRICRNVVDARPIDHGAASNQWRRQDDRGTPHGW